MRHPSLLSLLRPRLGLLLFLLLTGGGTFFNSPEQLFLEAASSSPQQSFSGKVVGVSDGDTITVLSDGIGYKVRLYGVDTPEKKQAFGAKAKKYTSSLAFGKEVTVTMISKDRYGRVVG